jgi:hypothetical protein
VKATGSNGTAARAAKLAITRAGPRMSRSESQKLPHDFSFVAAQKAAGHWSGSIFLLKFLFQKRQGEEEILAEELTEDNKGKLFSVLDIVGESKFPQFVGFITTTNYITENPWHWNISTRCSYYYY